MKIEYVHGNLFDTECKYILHGCNAQGKMGSGVAKTIRSIFPKAYNEYSTWHRAVGSDILGHIQIVDCGTKHVINAVTQLNYGFDSKRYASYDAIENCMQEVNDSLPGGTVAMPKIGSVLGGANWNIIEKIIEETLTRVQAKVYYL